MSTGDESGGNNANSLDDLNSDPNHSVSCSTAQRLPIIQ
jgi:hypothetical protein